ncbi:MAG TPA: RimK family protein [Stellaceae bacterium]|nr:RimK family protein [Stellaceae bacterium]
MPPHLIIVEKRKDFRWPDPDGQVVTMDDYVNGDVARFNWRRKIVNLCRSYDYLGTGYYCSLLAEARAQTVTPDIETILDLRARHGITDRAASLNHLLTPLDPLSRSIESLTLHLFFGQVEDAALKDFARRAFETFRYPLLEIELGRDEAGAWRVSGVRPFDLREIPADRDALFIAALEAFTSRPFRPLHRPRPPRFDLAILHDPKDPLPPSSSATLQRIADIANDMEIGVELIEKRDLARLTQFDALFIRETTAVPHHTFRFAKRAEQAGMPVIDDPTSIMRCTNKVFLAELLSGHGISAPATKLVTRRTVAAVAEQLSAPVVVKIPDGSFSRGVERAETRAEFERVTAELLKHSEIILLQEFIYTPFDWRIGVLAGEPLFAARYFMCDAHWQILKHGPDGSHTEGRTEAVAIEAVPPAVLELALAATRLIGNGLYGVDLKETKDGVFVIEVNDNPNLDVGLEDRVLGEALYRRILNTFADRVEQRSIERHARPLAPAPVPTPHLTLAHSAGA